MTLQLVEVHKICYHLSHHNRYVSCRNVLIIGYNGIICRKALESNYN